MGFAELIAPFLANVQAGEVEIYNEFSLQHELGFFLRGTLPDHHTQFERNALAMYPGKSFTKREIDIVVRSRVSGQVQWAIELKFPRNGQYPEQMFSFCKDIAFLEELRDAGIPNTALLVFAEDRPFFQGSGEGIYGYFRSGRPLCGTISKPTGEKNAAVTLRGTYYLDWRNVSGQLHCLAVDCGAKSQALDSPGESHS